MPAPTLPSADRLPVVPGYELLEVVGVGGMGIVYRARDQRLNREVAIKLLHERYSADSDALDRFKAEAQVTGQLQHPGIPAVHELGQLPNGLPFLAMKLVKGPTLHALLKEQADPSQEHGWFVAVFAQLCHAVGYAHAHQVIHRDLKPSNVMVGSHGEVQVMDWGLAKVLDPQRHPVPAGLDKDGAGQQPLASADDRAALPQAALETDPEATVSYVTPIETPQRGES